MKVSNDLLKFVEHFEGNQLKAYRDPVGVWTIGIGHTGPEAKAGNTISRARSYELLASDIGLAERAVSEQITVKLNQAEFDALVSFTFNCGRTALFTSTARKELNKGNRQHAADALLLWNKGEVNGKLVVLAGLTRRRQAERNLFLTGSYSTEGGIEESKDGLRAKRDRLRDDLQEADSPELQKELRVRLKRVINKIRHRRKGDDYASPNFRISEFDCNDGTPVPTTHHTALKRFCHDVLEPLRAQYGACTVNSGYRTRSWNQRVGGASRSQHIYTDHPGEVAADVTFANASPSTIAREARKDPDVGGIGHYSSFTHLDTGPRRDWNGP